MDHDKNIGIGYMAYELLGEGTYGCVYKPSLPCKEKGISYKNKLSKLMLTSAAIKEIQEYAMIDSVDKTAEFYTGKPVRCTLKNSPAVAAAVKKCGVNGIKNKTAKEVAKGSSLLIIGDGGLDLDKWVKQVKSAEVSGFWREMMRMFRGIQVLQKHSIVHHDIKPQNIVYNAETGRSALIDFGLMRSIKTEAARCSMIEGCNARSHWNYPTENMLSNRNVFDQVAGKTEEEKKKTLEVYLKNIRTGADTAFVKAYQVFVRHCVPKEDTDRRKRFVDRFWKAWRSLFLSVKPGAYSEFLQKTLNTFDVVGFGMTLMFILSRVKRFMKRSTVKKMDDLFFRMLTPNAFDRLTIDEAMAGYEEILTTL